MNTKRKIVKGTGKIALYLYLVLILLSLFTVATYTWFYLSQTPEVNDMALYVNSTAGMELSVDPLAEEWELQLDFAELLEEEGILRPVTWSDFDQKFYAVSYGFDGRMTQNLEPLYDERHANKDNADGYYIVGTFYARCDESVSVSLSPAVEVSEGLQGSGTYVIGTAVWNEELIRHEDGGYGAQYAIRIGFLIQKTDLKGNATDEPPTFMVYEPNCNVHVDGSGGFQDTASIDGTSTLVPYDRLIRQTESTWTEAYPVEKNKIVHKLGMIEPDKELFKLSAEELAQISVYVWLEGQDVDCTNVIGQECKVLASIQFDADPAAHSGLVPIEGSEINNQKDDHNNDMKTSR